MKVLVIDDEKPTLSMFKLFLNAYGYDVYTAENGEKGLDLFLKVRPGIVFTDIKMPGIDGLEVLKRIRQLNIPAEVIIITGHGDMDKAVEALDLEASDFINKPVEREALNSALNRAEKRLQSPEYRKFDIETSIKNGEFIINIGGRLSGKAEDILFDVLASYHEKNIKRAGIVFDENFSIDRAGISLLINFIKSLNKKGFSVYLDNLGYNYIRFFQMAGINKIADITDYKAEY